MPKSMNIQDEFLNNVRKEKISVLIYLTNGFQLKGNVIRFDNFIVIIEAEGKQQMIYKHAISTVIPSREVKFNNNEE